MYSAERSYQVLLTFIRSYFILRVVSDKLVLVIDFRDRNSVVVVNQKCSNTAKNLDALTGYFLEPFCVVLAYYSRPTDHVIYAYN